jgi:hypothetical protein
MLDRAKSYLLVHHVMAALPTFIQLRIVAHRLFGSDARTLRFGLDWIEVYAHTRIDDFEDIDVNGWTLTANCGICYSGKAWRDCHVGGCIVCWKGAGASLELYLLYKGGAAELASGAAVLLGAPAVGCIVKLIGTDGEPVGLTARMLIASTMLANRATPLTQEELVYISQAWDVQHGHYALDTSELFAGAVHTLDIAVSAVRCLAHLPGTVSRVGIRRCECLPVCLLEHYRYPPSPTLTSHTRHPPSPTVRQPPSLPSTPWCPGRSRLASLLPVSFRISASAVWPKMPTGLPPLSRFLPFTASMSTSGLPAELCSARV